MTKGNSLSKRKRNVLGVTTISIFIIAPFKYALLTNREVNMTGYMAKFLFLIGYATRLRRSLGCCATSCIEAPLA